MHTDAGAILAMYCLKSTEIGGHTLLSSARVVYEEIKKIRPDLLDVLMFSYFYTDRRGQELENTPPYDISPIFSLKGNELIS
jgi:hypothetical protein